jgi:hypothetical protein
MSEIQDAFITIQFLSLSEGPQRSVPGPCNSAPALGEISDDFFNL